MNQQKLDKFFLVVNPTSDNRKLITRAQRAAARQNAEVVAYCCIFSTQATEDPALLREVETHRYQLWLDEIFKPMVDAGIKVTYQIDWDPDWRDALCKAVAESDCDLIIRSSFNHRALKSANRRLLRAAKAPVLILKREAPLESGNILAALKLHDPDDAHAKLNDDILDFSKSLTNNIEACELHAVTAYSDWQGLVDPGDIARKTGIERKNAHIFDGSPAKGIEEVANAIDAEMVILGTAKPNGIAGRILGSTAEQVLDKLECDVIIFVS